MDVAIHWQDVDSSAKAVREIYPKAESCCVVVVLVEHIEKFWKNVRKIKCYHQPILNSIRLFSSSYVRRNTSNVSVWCITAVDVGVLLTPLYPNRSTVTG